MSYSRTRSFGKCPVCDATVYTRPTKHESTYEWCTNGCYYQRIYEETYATICVGDKKWEFDSPEPDASLYDRKEWRQVRDAILAERDKYRVEDLPLEIVAMLEALRTNPYDQATRCAYSDWLEERGKDDEALEVRSWVVEKLDARKWMITFAMGIEHLYSEVIEAGHTMHRGKVYCFGTDAGQDRLLDSDTRHEFWRCWSLVTGVSTDDDLLDETNFRCAC